MEKVLVVEDINMNFMVVKELLSEYDIFLKRASDGKEFFAIINKTQDFDLILMDLMLPDTDGIELTKYLISKNINIPVVFISAYTERCEEIYDLGVEYFISKPIFKELFFSILKKYIDLRVKVDERD